MNGYTSVFSLIDFGSFSNLWFWIAVAVAWSSATHFVIGVPFDMVQRARRKGGQAMADLEAMAALQARRRVQILSSGGAWLVGFWAMALTSLAVLGFGYGHELAQALTLLLLPLTLVSALGVRFALRLTRTPLQGKALARALTLHRILIQTIGLTAILITTMWGTWHNLTQQLMGG
ncbi:MAG: hypothetical protein Kow0013_04070 [Pararhodobacter sp.]